MSFLLGKSTMLLAMVTVCLVSLAIVARNWSCRHARPPRPPRSEVYTVAAVQSGVSIEATRGRSDRRRVLIVLDHVNAPADSAMADESRSNLARLAGKTVRAERERHGLLRGEDGESSAASRPVVGVVYGEMGACLNLAQVMDGMASCRSSAPKSWKAEEQSARKAKRGMWREQ